MKPKRALHPDDPPALQTPLIRGVIAHGRRILYQVMIFPAEGAAPGHRTPWIFENPVHVIDGRDDGPRRSGGEPITDTRC